MVQETFNKMWLILAGYGFEPINALFTLCLLNLCGILYVVTFRRYQVKVGGKARIKRVKKHKLVTKNRKKL